MRVMLNIVCTGVSTWGISDFYLFFIWKLYPLPWKKSPSSFPWPPSKSWGPVKPPPLFLKIWLEAQPLPPAERGGAHYVETSLKLELQTALTEAECEDFEEDWGLKNCFIYLHSRNPQIVFWINEPIILKRRFSVLRSGNYLTLKKQV